MTFEEALDKIAQLSPYYQKYNEKFSECENWKAERDVWQKQAMELSTRLIPPDPPQIIRTIPAPELADLVLAIYPNAIVESRVRFWDGAYPLTTIEEIRRFTAWDTTNKGIYSSEGMDCDDFAAALWGSFARYPYWSALPVGLLDGNIMGWHVFCLAIACEGDQTPRLYFIEPQNDAEIAIEVVEGTQLDILIFH